MNYRDLLEILAEAYVNAGTAEENRACYDYLRSRGVTSLVHFTPASNLYSIYKWGLVPVDNHEKIGIEATVTDGMRLEGKCFNNFSITTPNAGLLYSKTKQLKIPFALIKISIEILLNEGLAGRVFFTEHNAASGAAQILSGVDGLRLLFSEEEEYGGACYRRSIGIPANQTTDPQAEVLICGVVPVRYFTEISVETYIVRERVEKIGFACPVRQNFSINKYFVENKRWKEAC